MGICPVGICPVGICPGVFVLESSKACLGFTCLGVRVVQNVIFCVTSKFALTLTAWNSFALIYLDES